MKIFIHTRKFPNLFQFFRVQSKISEFILIFSTAVENLLFYHPHLFWGASIAVSEKTFLLLGFKLSHCMFIAVQIASQFEEVRQVIQSIELIFHILVLYHFNLHKVTNIFLYKERN